MRVRAAGGHWAGGRQSWPISGRRGVNTAALRHRKRRRPVSRPAGRCLSFAFLSKRFQRGLARGNRVHNSTHRASWRALPTAQTTTSDIPTPGHLGPLSTFKHVHQYMYLRSASYLGSQHDATRSSRARSYRSTASTHGAVYRLSTDGSDGRTLHRPCAAPTTQAASIKSRMESVCPA